MTRERKLAIEMWEQVVKQLKEENNMFNIANFKSKFCTEHKLHWFCDCYFCQYFRRCNVCPLRTCTSEGALYLKIFYFYAYSFDEKIDAAEKILSALKGGK